MVPSTTPIDRRLVSAFGGAVITAVYGGGVLLYLPEVRSSSEPITMWTLAGICLECDTIQDAWRALDALDAREPVKFAG